MRIRIEGSDLPGRRGGAEALALRRNNVQVGVQRRAEVVDRFPADAESVMREFEVASQEIDGLLDVGGPYTCMAVPAGGSLSVLGCRQRRRVRHIQADQAHVR